MDRLTDSAQGYCEMYCENYGIPGCDPETCARKGEKANRPYHVKVVFIGMGEHSAYFNVAYDNGRVFPFDFDQIGKDVFLTLESAEAMLEKEACEG